MQSISLVLELEIAALSNASNDYRVNILGI